MSNETEWLHSWRFCWNSCCAAQPCEESTDFPESPERRAQESPSRQGAAAWLETKEPLETQLRYAQPELVGYIRLYCIICMYVCIYIYI
jgi:hypothetical protein